MNKEINEVRTTLSSVTDRKLRHHPEVTLLIDGGPGLEPWQSGSRAHM